MTNVRSIFVSTACLPGVQPVTSRISLYRSHGLEAIELGAGVSADKDSLSQVVGMGCQFLVHNYFPPPPAPFVLNLASGDADIRRKSLDFVSEALALTASLGAPFYSVHAGFITDPASFGTTSFVFPMPASPDEAQSAMDRFITTLEIVTDRAQRLGVQVLVENNVCSPELRDKLLLQTADEFLELFGALRSPHLGMLLDIGHLNVTAHTLGFDRMSFVDQVAPYVRAFHVHDNDGMADTHQPVQPGSWVLDVLRRPEFARLPVIVEARFRSVADLRIHVDWLSACLANSEDGMNGVEKPVCRCCLSCLFNT
jgi:sugar phosphate isomerase/epimerase